MSLSGRKESGICALAVIVAGVVVGCTGDRVDLPPAAEAADGFLAAWSEQDAVGMSDYFTDDARGEWPPRRLGHWLSKRLDAGDIESISVERVGAVSQPDIGSEDELQEGVSVPVDYEIGFQSAALDQDAYIAGSFDLVYDGTGDRWGVEWDDGLLWPGIPGAASFDVTARWPERAPILDRRGRMLARGDAGNRVYAFGSVAGTTIGHIEPLAKKDVGDATEGHEAGDLVGGSGLEATYEDRLAGEPATKIVVTDKGGRRLEVLGSSDGKPGRPVRSTLDVDVQRAAETAYGGTTGGAVVMEPSTGDVLAAVSSSPFDPNGYVGVEGVEPFNRALAGLYPPGSSMKVVTASAALDAGVVTPSTNVTGPQEYQGVRNFESGVYGTIDFATAVRFSVNTAFAQVAEDLGTRRMVRYAEAFGFNEEPRTSGASTSSFPVPQDLADLMWGSIGQAQVLATPLQMASVSATVANRGERMRPRLTMHEPKTGERVISPRTARAMNRLMQSVVQGGTGTGAQVAGVPIAGKTGTAEVSVDGKILNHAWFTCFAPASQSEVAVAVVSEFGGVGGQVAAPLAGAILRGVLPIVAKR